MDKTSRITSYISAILLSAFGTSVSAQNTDMTVEICSATNVRKACQTSCAPACGEAGFLSEHTNYCLENGLIGLNITPQPDSAECVGFFKLKAPETDESGTSDADQAPSDECAKFGTYSERRRCELTKLTPECSSTVVELESRARLLVTQIGSELGQYSELLERDWTDITNRDSLCSFSIAQLDDNYQIASENPELLRALQRQATDIQSCQTDWESWSRNNAGTRGSDRLIDKLTREVEAQLGPLKERIARLGESVQKLESATDTIGEIIDVHIFFCDSEGSRPRDRTEQ